MYATGNKKMLNMLILEILRQYTDEEHSLTQQEILKLLDQNYGMECDRRSVKNNVMSLKEMGYDISTEKGYRLVSREFDDSELRILIDSVLFSKSISTKQAKGLIEKIRSLASNYFNAKVSHVCNLPELSRTINKQAMYSLDAINDAIADKKKKEADKGRCPGDVGAIQKVNDGEKGYGISIERPHKSIYVNQI